MIIAIDNRYALDAKLYKIQQYLDAKLTDDVIIYGQLHENDRQQGKILEWSYEEKEVFVDDRECMVIGFRVLSKTPGSGFLGTASIDCIVTTKTDNRELTEQTIYKHLIKCGYLNDITGMKIGIDQVFTGLFNDNIRYRDIYPFHVFAFTVNVNYNLGDC